MKVEGKDQSFYTLQSGEVKVMVPFTFARSGGLRSILDEESFQKILDFLGEPILIPEDEHESYENYVIKIHEARDEIKHRDPDALATIVKTLFYKKKLVELDKSETDIYQNAMKYLTEELAHLEHTTRQKASSTIRTALTNGRKERKALHEKH